MDPLSGLVLLLAVAWACGLNLYAAMLTLGLLAGHGDIVLPDGLRFLADPVVLSLAAFLYCVEFVADKTPGVDSAWDALHTFVRIPAGAALAMSWMGGIHAAAGLPAFVLGGALAGLSHVTKAGTRLLINTSPEPVSNWLASVGEDALVVLGILAAIYHPVLFTAALLAFIAFALWLLPHLWRAGRRLFAGLGEWLGGGRRVPAAALRSEPPRLPKP